MNKILIRILSRTVNESQRDWHEKLSLAVWAYRTSVRMSTGTTLYYYFYGAEALLPIEIELPSLRLAVTSDVPMDSLYYAETRLAELEALDERRMNALQHLDIYRALMVRAYEKRVNPRSFEVGDLFFVPIVRKDDGSELRG